MLYTYKKKKGIASFFFVVAWKQEDPRGNSISGCNWISSSGFPDCIHGKQASGVCTLG